MLFLHIHVGAAKYLECAHPPLPDEESRAWIARGSDQRKVLEEVVNDKTILNDMKQLTSFCHAGSLENFHSVMLKWAPKRLRFSYPGMRARVQLACLSHMQPQRGKVACDDKRRCAPLPARIYEECEALGDKTHQRAKLL